MEETIKVNWSFTALEMLYEIHEYLSEYSDSTADNYVDELYEYTERLKQLPEMCASCRNPKLNEKGYRCCTFKNHIIIYERRDKEVDILGIIHASRNPDDFEEMI